MKTCLLLSIAILTGLVLFPSPISAQTDTGIGLAISPLVFEITGNPGEKIENQIKITNRSESQTEIKITIEDIAPADEAGHVIVEPAETESYSIAKWVTVDTERFVLAPRENRWVTFRITLPENAEPGGHYGSIIAAGSAISGAQATGALIVPRVGALVLLSVPGDIEENLFIRDFSAPKYSEYGPINFDITFENKGTIHVKPKGLVTVTNWLGQKVGSVPFPEKNILPDAARKIQASWPQKWLWAGKYTATVTGNYGLSNTLLVPKVITFWAFPWKFGLIILIGLVFLFLARKRFIGAFKILLIGEKRR